MVNSHGSLAVYSGRQRKQCQAPFVGPGGKARVGLAQPPHFFDHGCCFNWSLYIVKDKYYCRRHAGEVLLDTITEVDKDGHEL